MKSDEYMTGNLAMRNHVRELKQRIADLETDKREILTTLTAAENREIQQGQRANVAEAENQRLREVLEKMQKQVKFNEGQSDTNAEYTRWFKLEGMILTALNKADPNG